MKLELLSWDTLELAEYGLGWQKEMAEDLGEDPEAITIEDIYNDPFFWQAEWENVCEELTELMDGREYWKVSGTDMGWRKLSGQKYLSVDNGKALLAGVLPETECTWKLYKKGDGFIVKNWHHDAPMGESYWIRPVAQSTFYKNNY